jgi:hypothetical protein
VALDYLCDFALVLDLLRGKIFVSDFAQMNVVVRILAAHAGIVIVSVKNRTGQSASCLLMPFISSFCFPFKSFACSDQTGREAGLVLGTFWSTSTWPLTRTSTSER